MDRLIVRTTMKQILILSVAAGLIAPVGCSPVFSSKKKVDVPTSSKEAGEIQVKVGGAMKLLSDGQIASTKAEPLLADVKRLLNQQRARSARAYLEKRPDMTLETLRSKLGRSEDEAALRAIAAVYDGQMGIPSKNGWSAVTKPETSRKMANYAKARQCVLDALRSGTSLDKALPELSASAAATENEVLLVDQLYLQGIVALLSDQPAKAVDHFRGACQKAESVDPYQEIQLALLLSDALRRAKRIDQANETWLTAVNRAARLGENKKVFDPVYWDRASYLRPVGVPWPPEVLKMLASRCHLELKFAPEELSEGEAEAIVWGAIAQGLINRGDHQSAIVAAKRAEAATTDATTIGWNRLAQAESLACLDQIPAATAVLVSLTTSDDDRLANSAIATLGGMKLRSGDAEAGFQLLAKAIDQQAAPEWPGRAKAEADLGLAYLLRHDESNGLKWLHSAQSRFTSEADVLEMSQSLWNEAEYLKHVKRKSDAVDVQNRLATLELDPLLAQQSNSAGGVRP